jgi:DNA-binding response OmpR family regulator
MSLGNILVVDDDRNLLELMGMMLQSTDYNHDRPTGTGRFRR